MSRAAITINIYLTSYLPSDEYTLNIGLDLGKYQICPKVFVSIISSIFINRSFPMCADLGL